MKKLLLCFFILSVIFSACTTYTQSPISTRTPQATPVLPTPYPTLLDELQMQFDRKLDTNGGCELPCFLGIKPGETLLNDAIIFFETYAYDHRMRPRPVNFYTPYQWHRSDFYLTNESKDREVLFTLDLQSTESVVSGLIIGFGPTLDPNRKADTKSKLLEHYGIMEILQRHGMPDEIYLYPTRNGQTQSAYSVEIVYNTEKIFASYPGIAKLTKNDKYKLCPAVGDGDVSSFDIALGNPLNAESDVIELAWGSFVKDFNPGYYRAHHQKLDAEAIYDLFIKKGQRCFYEDEYWIK
jgi:hypothetical protein